MWWYGWIEINVIEFNVWEGLSLLVGFVKLCVVGVRDMVVFLLFLSMIDVINGEWRYGVDNNWDWGIIFDSDVGL